MYFFILVFLCNFHYFRFMTFISLFLGVFNAFQVKFGPCYDQVLIKSYFRIYFLVGQVYRAFKQTSKSINVFSIIEITKNLDFCLLFSLVDSKLAITLGIQETPRGFEVYYQKLTVQFLFHKKEYHVCFLQFQQNIYYSIFFLIERL